MFGNRYQINVTIVATISLMAMGLNLAIANSLQQPKSPKPPTFEKDIQPILLRRCAKCHDQTPSAGYKVTSLGSVLEGGRSGKAVIPGSPESSHLFKLISTGKMPPAPSKMPAEEISVIAAWIRGGATGTGPRTGHWAFKSPQFVAIPATPVPFAYAANPIDRFLLSDLKKVGLSYSPQADRRTLIRRLTMDLIGLSPIMTEVDEFANDKSPDAYERVVDRLLADPRLGERWARHWLDTAGYADSEGVLEEDKFRLNAWRYRDYVIRSFNSDQPYDRFLKEQIAGDEMVDYKHAPAWTPEIESAIIATGFLRTAVDATRDDFNTHQFTEYQYRMLHDTQTILVSSTLGVTLQCARCHDHKYEPFTQCDYYSMQAILSGAIRPEGTLLPTNRRQIVAGTDLDQKHAKEANERVDAQIKKIDQQSAELLKQYKEKWTNAKLTTVPEADRQLLTQAIGTAAASQTPAQKALVTKYKAIVEPTAAVLEKEFPEFAAENKRLLSERQVDEKGRITLPELRAIYDQDVTPPPTHILLRGEYTQHGDVVQPGIPVSLSDPSRKFQVKPIGSTSTGRRLALAEWIASANNPLTARVEVNRSWAHLFGVGIVPAVDNFGTSGPPPTNQRLLDWLAVSFARGVNGSAPWSRKALLRLIVTSQAYQQASGKRPGSNPTVDPDNKLLWRQRSRRLEGEAFRDVVLQKAGALDTRMFGESINEEIKSTGEVAVVGETGMGRRSIYLLVRRSKPVTLLNTFDMPIMETNCTRRITSTTPTQSLAVMNGSFMAAQSHQMADRVMKGFGMEKVDPDFIVKAVYELAYQRKPSDGEIQMAMAFLNDQRDIYGRTAKLRPTARELALADLCLALLSANEFVYVD